MNKINSAKAVAVITTAIMMASLVWLMNTRSMNSSLETGLHDEKLKSESLLSEKLLLEKDIQKVKDQLASLKGKNSDLDGLLKSTSKKLEKQEAEFGRMKRENQSLGQIKKQRQELIALQSQLENEIQLLKNSQQELEAKNNELTTTVASLQERNKMLTDDLNRAMFAAVDRSQVQAVTRNSDKLTVKAKRTKKLIANFEVPANLRQLSFRILDSKGNALTQADGTIATRILPSDTNFTASSDETVKGNTLQKVEMTYFPKDKLKTGVYTVEILNENLYVGSLKVKLR